MPASAKFPLIFLIVLVSFLVLPMTGLPYTNFDWTVQSASYEPPPSDQCTYTVRFGDTLFSIARRFGTTVTAMADANSLSNTDYIYGGQILSIPNCRPVECEVYTVQQGDTLFSIARRYHTPVWAVVRRNRIPHPGLIFIGQPLVICHDGYAPSPAPYAYYVVQPGDTLWSIALRSGTTPYAIAVANDLWHPWLLYPGQRLRIP